MLLIQTTLFVCSALSLPQSAERGVQLGAEEARQAYAEFLSGQRVRETTARSARVGFAELHFGGRQDEQPWLVIAGEFRQVGPTERWTRWLAEAARVEWKDWQGVQAGRQALETMVRPNFAAWNGSSLLQLGPSTLHPKIWQGYVQGEFSTVLRHGALNCGLMHNARWLSEVLGEGALEHAMRSSTGLVFTVVSGAEGDSSGARTEIETDATGFPLCLRQTYAGKLKHMARVLERTQFQGVDMPAKVEIGYSELAGVWQSSWLSYAAPSDAAGVDLMDLPAEIARVDGAALVVDDHARRVYELGNAALAKEFAGNLRRRNAPLEEERAGLGLSQQLTALVFLGLTVLYAVRRRLKVAS